jgi:hypothetical protein
VTTTATALSGFRQLAAAAQSAGTSFAQMTVSMETFQRHLACYQALAQLTDRDQRAVASSLVPTWTGTPAELVASVRTAMS